MTATIHDKAIMTDEEALAAGMVDADGNEIVYAEQPRERRSLRLLVGR